MAIHQNRVIGYTFCVYEDTKAVIGDIFCLSEAPHGEPIPPAPIVEQILLRHLTELLLHSPGVDRIESQLLLHASGFHGEFLRDLGFTLFPRHFMVQSLEGRWSEPRFELPAELELRSWRDEDMPSAARLICDCYDKHPDSLINDQYRSVHGAMRFLNNIVRYSGCGVFSPQASQVVYDRRSETLIALLLGSRVSALSGHITQLCVSSAWRQRGLARILLSVAAYKFLRLGAGEISLTVTQANQPAIDLYQSEGYRCAHAFDANVWQRRGVISFLQNLRA